MKVTTTLGILLIVSLFVLACGKEDPVAPEPVPVPKLEPTPVAPVPIEPEPFVRETYSEPVSGDDTTVDVSKSTFTEAEQAAIDRWKKSCSQGSASLCAALKNKYGIDMKPGEALKPMADEPMES